MLNTFGLSISLHYSPPDFWRCCQQMGPSTTEAHEDQPPPQEAQGPTEAKCFAEGHRLKPGCLPVSCCHDQVTRPPPHHWPHTFIAAPWSCTGLLINPGLLPWHSLLSKTFSLISLSRQSFTVPSFPYLAGGTCGYPHANRKLFSTSSLLLLRMAASSYLKPFHTAVAAAQHSTALNTTLGIHGTTLSTG